MSVGHLKFKHWAATTRWFAAQIYSRIYQLQIALQSHISVWHQ